MAGTSRCIKSLLWNTEHGACMMLFIHEELHVGVQASFCRPGPLLSALFKSKVITTKWMRPRCSEYAARGGLR